MKLHSVETIISVLNEAGIRYLVAGGLAVNAHGYSRLTRDIDLIVALYYDNIIRVFGALEAADYRPVVPITARQFADARMRQQWIDEKGMKVLGFFSDTHRETPLDVFVYEPFDFDAEFAASLREELLPGLEVRFVSIPTLIRMKEVANRPKDIDDIQHLRWIMKDLDSDD